jgi:hypothetical protein
LWVIQGIVDKLRGKIEVESSTAGETWTCFSISLPANFREATDDGNEEKSEAARKQASSHSG